MYWPTRPSCGKTGKNGAQNRALHHVQEVPLTLVHKFCAALALCVGLTGCGNLQEQVTNRVLGQTSGAPDPGEVRYALLLRDEAEPLAVALEKFGTSATLLKEQNRLGVTTWIAADGASIRTKGGLLVGTRGLGGDILASDADASMAMVTRRRTGQVERFMTFLNGADRAETRSYVCDITTRGAAEVEFRSGNRNTTLMVEDCTNPTVDFTNFYWVDPQGRVLQSSQYAGDYLGTMVIRTVAPE